MHMIFWLKVHINLGGWTSYINQQNYVPRSGSTLDDRIYILLQALTNNVQEIDMNEESQLIKVCFYQPVVC